MQCCSCSAFTVCATCNVISPVKICFVLLHQHFPQYVCSDQNGCFLRFINFVLSLCVAQVLSEWFEMVPVAPLLPVSLLLSHSTCDEFLLWSLYILNSSVSFLITFLSPGIIIIIIIIVIVNISVNSSLRKTNFEVLLKALSLSNILCFIMYEKNKALPVPAWTGPLDSTSWRLLDF